MTTHQIHERLNDLLEEVERRAAKSHQFGELPVDLEIQIHEEQIEEIADLLEVVIDGLAREHGEPISVRDESAKDITFEVTGEQYLIAYDSRDPGTGLLASPYLRVLTDLDAPVEAICSWQEIANLYAS